MSRQLLFWVIMLLLLVFAVLDGRPATGTGPWNRYAIGMNIVTFILIALLGWQVYGPALH